VDHAYSLAYSRRPDAWEKDMALTFLARQAELIGSQAADRETAEMASLADLCLMLMNSNEFVYRF